MSGHEHLSKSERRHLRKIGKEQRRKERDEKMIQGVALMEEQRKPKEVKPLTAKTETQGHYILTIQKKQLTFGMGPAGTGKTYICAAMAADALKDKKIDKVIITRPAVESGQSLGFLPGDVVEKYEPYIAPFRQVFDERLGRGATEYYFKSKKIEAVPLNYMRGMTFNDAWVILDEAQNTTPEEMKMFLTRIGDNSKVIVNGDVSQSDIIGSVSGLLDASNRLRDSGRVGQVEFSMEDIVRSGLVREVLTAYMN